MILDNQPTYTTSVILWVVYAKKKKKPTDIPVNAVSTDA